MFENRKAQEANSSKLQDWKGLKNSIPISLEDFNIEDLESTDATISDDDGNWINWFVNLRGNEFFCEVDEDYIQDAFNMTGLSAMVPFYENALDMILDLESSYERKIAVSDVEIVEGSAKMLYGMIHARYILTAQGMNAMLEKFKGVEFGRCPRWFCEGQPVLPVGLSDTPGSGTVALYCPLCHDIYNPKSSCHAQIDGAYFGTTFPHLFLLTQPELIPAQHHSHETHYHYLRKEG